MGSVVYWGRQFHVEPKPEYDLTLLNRVGCLCEYGNKHHAFKAQVVPALWMVGCTARVCTWSWLWCCEELGSWFFEA